ncbi:MAG TPA: FAD-binding protein, partial [Nocardioidaceae bacterium]|nr:FAD-binding protein [Nocardioidaceae bacterium]
MQRWESWSGLETAQPAQVLTPASPAEVVDAVVAARAHGLTVKMVGSGHSFTGIGSPEDLQLVCDGLVGIRSVSDDGLVRVGSGTTLHRLNAEL